MFTTSYYIDLLPVVTRGTKSRKWDNGLMTEMTGQEFLKVLLAGYRDDTE